MPEERGPLELLAPTIADFVEGEFDLWQRLVGEAALLYQGLFQAVAQARTGNRRPWDLLEQVWRSLLDPRCAEEIEAFYRLDPDFERANIDRERLCRNARALAATARVALAACYCAAGDDGEPLLLGCAQEAASLLGGRTGGGIGGFGVADPDPAVTVHRTFDLLAASGWSVAGARLWTLTWLRSPCERHRLEIPVAGYHPGHRGFLATLHLAVLDGHGELVESPDRALHPLGPELVTAVRDTWARSGASVSVSWCLTVRPRDLPPWLPLDGPSLAGPLAVGLCLLAQRARYDGTVIIVSQPGPDGRGLEPVGFEREKLEAVVDWNREHTSEHGVIVRAVVSRDTSLPQKDVEAMRIRGIRVTRITDIHAAARFAEPPRNRRPLTIGVAVAVAMSLVGSLLVALVVRPPKCPSETGLTVAAMWSGQEQDRFGEVLEEFCQETGIGVTYNDVPKNHMPEYLSQRAMDPPDVAMVPQPGLIRDLVAQGRLQPLGEEASKNVRENYLALAQNVMTTDGKLYGVWFKGSNKSLWWYNPEILRAREINPQGAWTWDQMLDVARHSETKGPWLAIGASDGWPLTDLFENVYLRDAGPGCYDALSVHAIPWNHSTVVDALTKMQDLFVEGGVVHDTNFELSVGHILGSEPAAATLYGADFVLSVLQSHPSAKAETDFDYFEFPAVDNSDPMIVAGGDIAVALTDKPAVQQLLAFLATPKAAAIWARRGGFVSPSHKVDPSNYRDRMTKRAAQILTRDLTGTGSLRFDLSDLQPPMFGAKPEAGTQLRLQKLVGGQEEPRTVADKIEADAVEAYRNAPWRGLAAHAGRADCGNPSS